MKAPAFDYVRPATVEEAVAALGQANGDGRLLAGGQSLVPMLNLRLAYPELLIDIAGLADLCVCHEEVGRVSFGARVTHSAIEDGAGGDHWGGMLRHVARDIAYRAVRNRGTLGGSLAHADPAADWPVAMAALGAEVELVGAAGSRRLAVDSFALDIFTTALEPDEMVVGVELPKRTAATRWSYIKIRRKAGAFADALAAVVHDPETGFTRVVTGGVSVGGARRLPLLERLLPDGTAGTLPEIATAFDAIAGDAEAYHRRLHLAALRRAITEIDL